jgi:hypothetical protein
MMIGILLGVLRYGGMGGQDAMGTALHDVPPCPGRVIRMAAVIVG